MTRSILNIQKLSLAVSTGLAISFLAFQVSGQQLALKAKEVDEKFSQSRKTSEEIMKIYSWNSRIDVTKEGKVMDILIEEIRYGPDGKQQRKVINDQEAKLPSSFLIHQVAEEMKDKMVSFMNNLHLFLERYALDDENKRGAFFSRAIFGAPDANGQFLVSGDDVIIKGDKLLWWIDFHNYSITKASISTTFDGEQVEFTASYKYIPPGLNYMAFAEILVPVKGIMVQLHFYDFTKIN